MLVSEEISSLFWYHFLVSLEIGVLLVDVVCQAQLQSEPNMVFSDQGLLVPALPCAHSCCMFTCVWHVGCYLAWHWYGGVVCVPGTYIIWPKWQPQQYACVLIKYDQTVIKHYFPNMYMFEWVLKADYGIALTIVCVAFDGHFWPPTKPCETMPTPDWHPNRADNCLLCMLWWALLPPKSQSKVILDRSWPACESHSQVNNFGTFQWKHCFVSLFQSTCILGCLTMGPC